MAIAVANPPLLERKVRRISIDLVGERDEILTRLRVDVPRDHGTFSMLVKKPSPEQAPHRSGHGSWSFAAF